MFEMKVIFAVYLCIGAVTAYSNGGNSEPEVNDYCSTESFAPRCSRNEAVLMQSAVYGRMRIGRCVTAQEVSELGGMRDDPRFLHCSSSILPILDSKCSGRTSCEVRIHDISLENVTPCFSGLKMYLEADYTCVAVAEERRSCYVAASHKTVHINGTSEPSRICGTKSQPWNIEAPIGQAVSISLIDFKTSSSEETSNRNQQQCKIYAMIIDKAIKRNVSVCGGGTERERKVYASAGNSVELIFPPFDAKNPLQFMLKVEAVGCADIIPPEDAWLKRKESEIIIGCYSNRVTWRLHCDDGRWVGSIGNCSYGSFTKDVEVESNPKETATNTNQVVLLIAILGFTMALCLAILCIGIVCLRRLKSQGRKKQDYKIVNYNTARTGAGSTMVHPEFLLSSANDRNCTLPNATYSMYMGGNPSTNSTLQS